jgi:hypothetical protein
MLLLVGLQKIFHKDIQDGNINSVFVIGITTLLVFRKYCDVSISLSVSRRPAKVIIYYKPRRSYPNH